MTEFVVTVDGDLFDSLNKCINMGPIHEIKADGSCSRMRYDALVARVGGLKIEIFSNEHPPPHFRVGFQGSTANFKISDGSRLNGSGEILKYEKNIYRWWSSNKELLIKFWNNFRPGNCPVGLYREM